MINLHAYEDEDWLRSFVTYVAPPVMMPHRTSSMDFIFIEIDPFMKFPYDS